MMSMSTRNRVSQGQHSGFRAARARVARCKSGEYSPVRRVFVLGAEPGSGYGVLMGDKSPKATQKQKSQKDAKSSASDKQKSAAAAAKAAPKPTKK